MTLGKRNFYGHLKDSYLIFFSAAIFLYAFWGSPTPDKPSWIEALIALLLFLSIGGVVGIIRIFDLLKNKKLIIASSGVLILLYLIIVPMIISITEDYDDVSIMRDIIGIGFLMLPIILTKFFIDYPCRINVFIFILIGLALIFCLRVLMPDVKFLNHDATELLYLANSPIVLFSLFYVPFFALSQFYQKITVQQFTTMAIMIFVGIIIFLATLQDVQRAPILVLAISSIFLSILGFIYAPRRLLYVYCLFFIPCFFLFPYLQGIFDDVVQKTIRVGVNMRSQELIAIWESMQDSPIHIIFGSGWGASYASPAVGNLYVTYSHSLLSYIFFKAGLIGLLIVSLYIWGYFLMIWEIAKRDLILANALFWALLIPVFLYASHKSFDFGLLLTLIFVSYYKNKKTVQKA